jgi:hypothetical protein
MKAHYYSNKLVQNLFSELTIKRFSEIAGKPHLHLNKLIVEYFTQGCNNIESNDYKLYDNNNFINN